MKVVVIEFTKVDLPYGWLNRRPTDEGLTHLKIILSFEFN
jgi:hypothetical protein